MSEVNPFYLATFAIYLTIILLIGGWAYLKTNTVDDFWVYGKDLGPTLATWSFVANFVSSVSVIGFIGAVYADGYSIMTGVIFGLMLGIGCLYFVVDKIRNIDKFTLPDIIAEVTGSQRARPIAGAVLLANAWIYLIMQLTGAGLLVTTITGVPYEYMIWVIGGVFIIYTVLGGLVSVAWTDLLQGTLMVIMITLALGYMILDIGGISATNAQFAAINPGLVVPLGDGVYTVIGAIAGIIAFFGTVFTEQNNIVRISATDSVKTAKIHIAAAGVILSVMYALLILLGGATTVALYNAGLNVENVDLAFPVLITEYLPTTVGIFIILAILSGILSTTDTRLHSCGITTARDIYDYFDPNASDQRLMNISRISTIFFGITATAIAVDPPGTILELYAWRAVLLTSAFLLPVYLALYKRDIPGEAIVLSIIAGAVLGMGWDLLGAPLGFPAVFMGLSAAALALVIGHVAWASPPAPTPTAD